jgi:hypothetical protein
MGMVGEPLTVAESIRVVDESRVSAGNFRMFARRQFENEVRVSDDAD